MDLETDIWRDGHRLYQAGPQAHGVHGICVDMKGVRKTGEADMKCAELDPHCAEQGVVLAVS